MTFVAGQVPTAAELNAIISNVFTAGTAGTDYTPTLTQGVTVTKTIEYSKYLMVGKWCLVNVSLSPTSAGTAGQPIVIGLPPVTPLAYRQIGSGNVYDASVPAYYQGGVFWVSATTCRIVPAGANGALGQVTMTAAITTGDLVGLQLAYPTT